MNFEIRFGLVLGLILVVVLAVVNAGPTIKNGPSETPVNVGSSPRLVLEQPSFSEHGD